MKRCVACRRPFVAADWTCPACGATPERRNGHLAFAPALAESSEGFEAEYFDPLAAVEEEYFWFRARNRLIVWALQTYFPHARNVLEIGCGNGQVLADLRAARPGLELAGCEIFSAGLARAAQRLPDVALFQMDARDIPFVDEFDVIGAFDVLEHITDDEAVLASMFQATRRRGGILLAVPQHRFLWGPSDVYGRHKRRYTAAELRSKVRAAGFHVVRSTSFVALLLPILLARRAVQRRPGYRFEHAREFSISPAMNRVLEQVMALERRLITAGVSFPAGGSRLVVARKP